ncbi:7606_t:CDS:2 [Cetraspora pellucida]|uniref:7606_t:CDS:1 n=1 Tax=Cetraspora pellucida TaxID=1433469 RepID=A0A9N9CAF4_9GLOM|nr:7606_t:CDS:2 [Cetraspora pellucida]
MIIPFVREWLYLTNLKVIKCSNTGEILFDKLRADSIMAHLFFYEKRNT